MVRNHQRFTLTTFDRGAGLTQRHLFDELTQALTFEGLLELLLGGVGHLRQGAWQNAFEVAVVGVVADRAHHTFGTTQDLRLDEGQLLGDCQQEPAWHELVLDILWQRAQQVAHQRADIDPHFLILFDRRWVDDRAFGVNTERTFQRQRGCDRDGKLPDSSGSQRVLYLTGRHR